MNRIKTTIDTGGNKPVLVFLHGFCESKQIWEQFTHPLQTHYRLILIDLPGFGDNTEPQPNYTMESNAAYVREVLAALAIRKCVLIGHSMGGKAAMMLALTQPDKVRRLVVADIAPVAYGHSQQPQVDAMRRVDLARVTTRAQAGWVDSITAVADQRGVTSTPTVFLNGAPVPVAGLTPEKLQAMIESAPPAPAK